MSFTVSGVSGKIPENEMFSTGTNKNLQFQALSLSNYYFAILV